MSYGVGLRPPGIQTSYSTGKLLVTVDAVVGVPLLWVISRAVCWCLGWLVVWKCV